MRILITSGVEQLPEESNALTGPFLPSFDPICMLEIGSEASYEQWKDDDSSVRFSSRRGVPFQTRRVQLFVALIPTPWTLRLEMNLSGFSVVIYHPRMYFNLSPHCVRGLPILVGENRTVGETARWRWWTTKINSVRLVSWNIKYSCQSI